MVKFGLITYICKCYVNFRLICASTVEENILKKANQKRMLGNIAIEGGAFTTEFFKQVIVTFIHTLYLSTIGPQALMTTRPTYSSL